MKFHANSKLKLSKSPSWLIFDAHLLCYTVTFIWSTAGTGTSSTCLVIGTIGLVTKVVQRLKFRITAGLVSVATTTERLCEPSYHTAFDWGSAAASMFMSYITEKTSGNPGMVILKPVVCWTILSLDEKE